MKNRDLTAKYRIRPYRPFVWVAFIRRLGSRLLAVTRMLKRDLRARYGLGPGAMLKAWRLGFSCLSYRLYELDKNPPRDYLSDDASRVPLQAVSGPFNWAVNDKFLFPNTLAQFGMRCPRVLAAVHRGTINVMGDEWSSPTDMRALDKLLDRTHPVVCKPVHGYGGMGIVFLDKRDEDYWINGEAAPSADVSGLLSEMHNYLICEFIQQGAYAAAICPDTTNTVRLLTLWDQEAAEPFIAAAAHRFGLKRSFPVDSWQGGAGGMSAPIQIDSGVLGAAAGFSKEGQVVRHARHPETQAEIEGLTVPCWEETSRKILEMATHLCPIRVLGWDLVITDEGPVCLEANAPPGVTVWQVNQPLLADPRIRRCLELYGVV